MSSRRHRLCCMTAYNPPGSPEGTLIRPAMTALEHDKSPNATEENCISTYSPLALHRIVCCTLRFNAWVVFSR